MHQKAAKGTAGKTLQGRSGSTLFDHAGLYVQNIRTVRVAMVKVVD